MPGYRVKPVAKAVKEKLKYDLKDYCAMRGLSLSSFYKGYSKKKYDYSVPYMTSYSAIIVHEDDDDIKSFADLKGKRSTHSVNSMWIPTV